MVKVYMSLYGKSAENATVFMDNSEKIVVYGFQRRIQHSSYIHRPYLINPNACRQNPANPMKQVTFCQAA